MSLFSLFQEKFPVPDRYKEIVNNEVKALEDFADFLEKSESYLIKNCEISYFGFPGYLTFNDYKVKPKKERVAYISEYLLKRFLISKFGEERFNGCLCDEDCDCDDDCGDFLYDNIYLNDDNDEGYDLSDSEPSNSLKKHHCTDGSFEILDDLNDELTLDEKPDYEEVYWDNRPEYKSITNETEELYQANKRLFDINKELESENYRLEILIAGKDACISNLKSEGEQLKRSREFLQTQIDDLRADSVKLKNNLMMTIANKRPLFSTDKCLWCNAVLVYEPIYNYSNEISTFSYNHTVSSIYYCYGRCGYFVNSNSIFTQMKRISYDYISSIGPYYLTDKEVYELAIFGKFENKYCKIEILRNNKNKMKRTTYNITLYKVKEKELSNNLDLSDVKQKLIDNQCFENYYDDFPKAKYSTSRYPELHNPTLLYKYRYDLVEFLF